MAFSIYEGIWRVQYESKAQAETAYNSIMEHNANVENVYPANKVRLTVADS